MRAPWMCAVASLRKRWVSAMVLTLVVGFTGTVVLAALAGARRSDSAFTRMKVETRAADLRVFGPAIDPATLAELRDLPGVAAIGLGRQLTMQIGRTFGSFGGALDDQVGRTVERPRLLEGRRPRQHRIDEVAVPEPLADKLGRRTGDSIKIESFSAAQVDRALSGGGSTALGGPEGPRIRLRIVGITRAPGDLSIEGSGGGLLFATRAFVRRYGDEIGSFAPVVLLVRLTDPAFASRFVRIARARLASAGAPGEFQVQPTSETEGGVQESIGVLTTGLIVFAVVAGLAGLVVIGVALRRVADGFAGDLPVLRALGVSRAERVLTVGLTMVPVAFGGALLAAAGAYATSPIMPLGLARRAEPELGPRVDSAVLGVGFVAVLLAVMGLALWSARRVVVLSGKEVDAPPSSRFARRAVAAGLAPPVTVGLAMTLDPGRGSRAVPLRAGFVGAVVAVLGVVAVAVFGTSLGALERTPRAYGYNWDVDTAIGKGGPHRPAGPCTGLKSRLPEDRAIIGASELCTSTAEVDGHAVNAVGFARLRGNLGPTVLDGRAPRAPDEIALGTATLAAIDAGIGDEVRVAGPDATHRYRVVGRVALPEFNGTSDVQAVADGASLTGRGFAAISRDDSERPRIVIRWRPGADVHAAEARLRALPEHVGPRFFATRVPLEVDRLQQVHALPWVLGAFLALIGVLGLSYALVTCVRRRGRDFATLKTIGFRQRQVASAVAVQATVVAGVGVLVGVPFGVVVGRLVWDRVADRAGFLADPTVPALAIAVVVIVTVVVANAVALVPARRAARLQPAVVLRSE